MRNIMVTEAEVGIKNWTAVLLWSWERKSYRKAFPYLLQAAELNDPHCQNLVGYCYDLGLGVEKNTQLALFWYRQAARNDDKEALGNLALHYERGEGVKASLRKAFLLYKRAAELGLLWAQVIWGSHTLKA
jgi:uncharacterized protein